MPQSTSSSSAAGARQQQHPRAAKQFKDVMSEITPEEQIIKAAPQDLVKWIRSSNTADRWQNRIFYVVPLLFMKLLILTSESALAIVSHFGPESDDIAFDI
jgi:hypothetical protein